MMSADSKINTPKKMVASPKKPGNNDLHNHDVDAKENTKKTPKSSANESKDSHTKSKSMKTDKHAKEKTGRFWEWKKDIFLGAINVIFVIGLVTLLGKLPTQARKLQSLNQNSFLLSTVSDEQIQEFELEVNKESIDKIGSFFPDEEGLLDFISDIEDLKTDGSVVDFSFVSKDPVKDKTKSLGFPIVIEMRGSWEEIDRDIQRIQKLPYLFRPVSMDAAELQEESVVEFSYGGFLYVDESFKKDR